MTENIRMSVQQLAKEVKNDTIDQDLAMWLLARVDDEGMINIEVNNEMILKLLAEPDFDYRLIVEHGLVVDGFEIVDQDLKNTSFENLSFEDVSFIRCDLQGASFKGCSMTGCLLLDCNVVATAFSQCDMEDIEVKFTKNHVIFTVDQCD